MFTKFRKALLIVSCSFLFTSIVSWVSRLKVKQVPLSVRAKMNSWESTIISEITVWHDCWTLFYCLFNTWFGNGSKLQMNSTRSFLVSKGIYWFSNKDYSYIEKSFYCKDGASLFFVFYSSPISVLCYPSVITFHKIFAFSMGLYLEFGYLSET